MPMRLLASVEDSMSDTGHVVIPPDLDIPAGKECLEGLLAALDPSRDILDLELGEGDPSQVALQLFFATLKEAENREIEVSLGERAEKIRAAAQQGN